MKNEGRLVKSFTDHYNKKGKIGDKVTNVYDENSEVKTVKEIKSRGIAGTHIYYEEGGSALAFSCKIVKG